MDKIKEAIEVLYDEHVPIVKFFGLPANFKIPRPQLAVMLFSANPTTPEDSKRMTENSEVFIEMLVLAEVLAIARPDKETPTEAGSVQILTAGTKFDQFIEEVKKYIDTDAIIMRSLGVSRQDFDAIANEYKKIIADVNDIDSVLVNWADLDPDAKEGIIRGILLQRSILAEVVQNMRNRLAPVIKHQNETMVWLNGMLGIQGIPPK